LVLALGAAAALPFIACGGGGYGDWGQPDPVAVDTSGRLAIAWTLQGMPLTSATCKAQQIDSMEVYVTSDLDGQNQVQFENVVCGLDRYSMEMIASGPVSLQVNAVHLLNSQTECTRYAGLAHAKATTQFAQTPTPVALLPVVSCP
jgi:hypothetical protein